MSGRFAEEQNLIQVYLERFGSDNTRKAYQNDLEHFFSFLGTSRPNTRVVRKVDYQAVNAWIEHIELQFKASTVLRRISAVRSFFDWLVATETLNANPANRHIVRKTARMRTGDRPAITLTTPQARSLIDAADNLRDRALLTTMLYCMLRRGETAAMDVEHLRETDGHAILMIPTAKGGRDQYVKIPDVAHDAIVEHLKASGIRSGAIWLSMSNRNRGQRITDRTIYNVVYACSVRAGLYRIFPHVLRHTGCTLAIEAGASITAVQEHARHQSINTTMGYVHQKKRLDKSAGDYLKV